MVQRAHGRGAWVVYINAVARLRFWAVGITQLYFLHAHHRQICKPKIKLVLQFCALRPAAIDTLIVLLAVNKLRARFS